MTLRLRGLEFPESLHYLVDEDTWARVEPDGTVLVGITALGLALAGELYMCRVKSPGIVVEAGRAVAVVELAKSVMSVRSPVGGTVVEAHEAPQARPQAIAGDPYGAGWLARLRPASPEALAADLARLVTGDALADAMRARIDREPPSALPAG
ncbi:MAG: glycine cleavage system protein H [Burkholderiales bacterium]|jgi:glycine cleavage system H protein